MIDCRCRVLRGLLLALALLMAPSTPWAQEVVIEDEEAARANPEALLAAAVQLMERGLLDQAGTVIDRAEEYGAEINLVRFQRARLAERQGDLEAAAGFYRDMLLDEPDALRVRLELGRVYFLLEDDTKSQLQFNYALAGDLPEPVVANVRRFLRQIKARRRWALGFDFAFAPDTNINAATSKREVELFNLPFRLNDDAREESGVGIDFRLNGRYDVPLTSNVLLRQTGTLRRVDYDGGNFDDMNLALSAGPLLRRGDDEYSLAVQGGYRWFRDDRYSQFYGLRGSWRGRITDRTELQIGLQGLQLEHETNERLDGPRYSISIDPFYSLSPQSLLRGALTLDREETDDPTERSTGIFLGVGLFTELPAGFNIYVEPGIELRHYEEELVAFGDRKDSITGSFEINLRNRQLDFYGFTPLIGTILERRWSKLDFFEFERARFTLGVTREF